MESLTPSQVILSDRWQLRAKVLTFLIFPSLRGRNRMGRKSPHPPSLGTPLLLPPPHSFSFSPPHCCCPGPLAVSRLLSLSPSKLQVFQSSGTLLETRTCHFCGKDRVHTGKKVLPNIHITGWRHIAQIHREVSKSDSF